MDTISLFLFFQDIGDNSLDQNLISIAFHELEYIQLHSKNH